MSAFTWIGIRRIASYADHTSDVVSYVAMPLDHVSLYKYTSNRFCLVNKLRGGCVVSGYVTSRIRIPILFVHQDPLGDVFFAELSSKIFVTYRM